MDCQKGHAGDTMTSCPAFMSFFILADAFPFDSVFSVIIPLLLLFVLDLKNTHRTLPGIKAKHVFVSEQAPE